MELRALVERRKKLADLHDEARGSWPLEHPEFTRVVRQVASGLATVAEEVLRSREATPAEIVRSQMWLGDALFDLAQGRQAPFAPAIEAYRKAEPYLRIAHDVLLSAKFEANFANILMRAEPSSHVLEDVIGRYELALPVLREHEPAYATRISAELERAQRLLAQLRELTLELRARRQEISDWLASGSFGSLSRPNAEAFAAQLHELVDAHADAERTGDFSAVLLLMERATAVFQRLMAILSPADPGPRGRFGATVMKLWAQLTAATMNAQVDKVTRDRAFDVMPVLLEVRDAILNAPEEQIAAATAQRLLPAAAEGRRILTRSLVTWTTPLWPVDTSPALPHGLYITASAYRDKVTALAERFGLEMLEIQTGRELAEATFDAIRRAAVVVADVLTDPWPRAAACYEIGIALSLGKPLVVLAPPGSGLPFDIDIAAVSYPDAGAGLETLADTLERALLLPQRMPDTGSLSALVSAARRRFPAQPANVDEIERCANRPLEAEAALANVLRQDTAQTGHPRLLVHTAWTRVYPTPGERRLFHVMPFGAAWSETVKRRTAGVCAEHRSRYRRGDDVEDQRVIRSIWDEICLASHVLVDLTDMNPNVTLELGVAHALGKNVLAVAQPGTVPRLFPTLKNVRVSEYTPDLDRYPTLVAQFLARDSVAE